MVAPEASTEADSDPHETALNTHRICLFQEQPGGGHSRLWYAAVVVLGLIWLRFGQAGLVSAAILVGAGWYSLSPQSKGIFQDAL